MQTPQEFLEKFLSERHCENGMPDGRPLFEYGCSEDEFDEILKVLEDQRTRVDNMELPPCTAALFTLYCSEWCRQKYDGGAWGWQRILISIDWRFGDRRHIPWVESGLRFWRRRLFIRDRGTEYLYTLVAEGGIPNHLLTGHAGVFSGYLKALIDFRRRYAQHGADALAHAERELNRLPVIWQKPAIAQLANQLADQIWELAGILGEVAPHEDPIQILDQQRPRWRAQLPVDLSGEEIISIIRSLVRDARKRPEIRLIRLRRYLQYTNQAWNLRAELQMPTRIFGEQIAGAIKQNLQTLPDRLELYMSIEESPDLIALMSRQRIDHESDFKYALRSTNKEKLPTFQVAKEIELHIGQRERILGELPLVGGDALNVEMPWCFKSIDDAENELELLTQGSCRSSRGKIFVLCRGRPIPVADQHTGQVEALAEGFDEGRTLWQITGESKLESREDGEVFKFAPNTQEIGETHYCLVGKARHHPRAKHRLFESEPDVFVYDDDGRTERVGKDSLRWRPIGSREWRPLGRRHELWGDIDLAHFDDKVCLAQWRTTIIPENIQFRSKATDESSGTVEILGPGLTGVLIESAEGLKTDVEEADDKWSVCCSRQNSDAATIDGIIQRDDLSAHFSVPFPAQGAVFVDPDDRVLPNYTKISVTQLYGYRAQFVSLDENGRYVFIASLGQLPPIEFKVPMGGNPTSTLSLQQFKEDFEQLFAQRFGVDNDIRVELQGPGQKLIRTLYLSQFEARLQADSGDSSITLDALDVVRPIYQRLHPPLELYPLDDFTAEPVQLSWNPEKFGWDLQDSEEAFGSERTYFGVVACERSDFVRPFVLPSHQPPEAQCESASRIQRAMLRPGGAERLAWIGTTLDAIERNPNSNDLQELMAAIFWFGRIHPHGSDLVGKLVERPNVLAHLWFLTIGDPNRQLKDNLERIREKCLFDWWFIPAQVWERAAINWRDSLFEQVTNTVYRDWYRKEARTHLAALASDCEALVATCEVIALTLELSDYPISLVKPIKHKELVYCWNALFKKIRDQQSAISRDLAWPRMQSLSDSCDQLPQLTRDLVSLMRAGFSQGGFPRWVTDVLLAPVEAAAYLHSDIRLSEEQKSDLMAAKRFHPVIFDSSFSFAQAIFLIHVSRT